MSTKPRSDAPLLNLSHDDREKLREALLAGMSYTDAVAFAEHELDVQTSRSSIALFWQKECLPVRLLRRAEAAEDAEQLASAGAARPGRFTEAAKQAIHERLYHLSNNPDSKPGELTVVNDIIMRDRESLLKEREVALKERAVAVQEARCALDKQAADQLLKDSELATPEGRYKLWRQEIEKAVHDEHTDLMLQWSNEVAVWQAAKNEGHDPGPMPALDTEKMKTELYAKIGMDYPFDANPEQSQAIHGDPDKSMLIHANPC